VTNKEKRADGQELSGWVESAELVRGMKVLTSDGRKLVVQAVVEKNQYPDTYNLTVADFHTYFVGQSHVWVHNVSPDCDLPGWENEGGMQPKNPAGTYRDANGKLRDRDRISLQEILTLAIL